MATAVLSTAAVFLLIRAVPGDVVGEMLGQSAGDRAAEAALRAFFGLDRPLWQQYFGWAADVLRGDLGESWRQGLPVAGIVGEAFLVTLQIGLVTLVVSLLVGVPLGIVAGVRQGRWPDLVVEAFSLVALSAPVFWTGMVLLIATGTWLGWSPPLIYARPGENLSDNLESIALPVLALGLLQAAAYAQFARQQTAMVMRQDFIRAAIARGLPLFAICRGAQEANVALGGSLYQAVQEAVTEAGPLADHRAPEGQPPELQYAVAHPVALVPGGLLASLGLPARFEVNSLHGQAVKQLAPGLRPEALAPDGLVEAFSVAGAPGFALCVQWHPEWLAADNPVSMQMLQAFGAAARAYRDRHKPLV